MCAYPKGVGAVLRLRLVRYAPAPVLVASSIAQLFREGVEAVTARTRDVLAAT